MLAVSGQPGGLEHPGELEHPLAYRAGDHGRNHALASSLLPWTRKGEDELRAQSVSAAACLSGSVGVSSTALCLYLLLEHLVLHQ